jgi:hypothetical protein
VAAGRLLDVVDDDYPFLSGLTLPVTLTAGSLVAYNVLMLLADRNLPGPPLQVVEGRDPYTLGRR